MLVEIFNKFVCVREVRSGGPLIFFVGTFIAHPSGRESNSRSDG